METLTVTATRFSYINLTTASLISTVTTTIDPATIDRHQRYRSSLILSPRHPHSKPIAYFLSSNSFDNRQLHQPPRQNPIASVGDDDTTTTNHIVRRSDERRK
ncbi:hypothetical protein BDE02_07G073400 [Populus trichocarpa]|nr:hypothetical protein BDE02_07G073400 [Populus trichocarpa]